MVRRFVHVSGAVETVTWLPSDARTAEKSSAKAVAQAVARFDADHSAGELTKAAISSSASRKNSATNATRPAKRATKKRVAESKSSPLRWTVWSGNEAARRSSSVASEPEESCGHRTTKSNDVETPRSLMVFDSASLVFIRGRAQKRLTSDYMISW